MDRILHPRRMQMLLALAAVFVAIVLGGAIKVGRDMAGYLETSVSPIAAGVTTGTASPFGAQHAHSAPSPTGAATEATTRAGNDTADVRSTGMIIAGTQGR